MPTVDNTLIVQIINFLFLLFILNIVLFRPIRRILSQRKEKIDNFNEMIGDFRGRFEQSEKSLNENMIGARKEGFTRKEGLKSEGLDLERDMLKEATSSANERITQAKENIEKQIGGLRESLEKEVDTFSKDLAQKILGRNI